MDPTIGWFVSIASLSSLAWAGGYYLGRHGAASARAGLLGGLSLMAVWGWLHYHPAVALNVLPLSVLAKVEGVGGVPLFMFLLGLAWSRAQLPRQKRVITWAILFGAVFFIQGGLWMLQSTPEHSFAGTVGDQPVQQSQEYSCVPASCAQALELLGIKSSERQMAQLTQTRPGTGSTIFRAMKGLRERLETTRYRVELVEVKPRDLRYMPCPMLTALKYETTRRHMVVITSVDDGGVSVFDPIGGPVHLSWTGLDKLFNGSVLVFLPR